MPQTERPNSEHPSSEHPSAEHTDRTDDEGILAAWSRQLVDALQIAPFDIDQQAVLGLAGRAAHAVLRPAAPLTTFIVGYAAGLATASGKNADDAVRDAAEVAIQLCRTSADPA